jgi:hypothetical protein
MLSQSHSQVLALKQSHANAGYRVARRADKRGHYMNMASVEVARMACLVTSSLIRVWPKTRSKELKIYYGLGVPVILFIIYAL